MGAVARYILYEKCGSYWDDIVVKYGNDVLVKSNINNLYWVKRRGARKP